MCVCSFSVSVVGVSLEHSVQIGPSVGFESTARFEDAVVYIFHVVRLARPRSHFVLAARQAWKGEGKGKRNGNGKERLRSPISRLHR